MRILVVDDQDQMRKSIKKLLLKMGIKDVIEASDGSEAIIEIEKQRIDLILCDLFMRRVQGLEVLDFLRNRQIANDIPYIVITGEGSRDDIVKSADKGADGYLLKPFQIEEFEDKIIAVLNKFFSPSELIKNLRLSENFILEKKFDEAINTLKIALEKDPNSVRAKYSLALALNSVGRTKEATSCLIENIKNSPDYYRNYAMLGNIYLKENNTSKAIETINKELELHPKQPKRQTQLATLLMKEGSTEKAVNHLREALKEDGKYLPALLTMGQAFTVLKDIEKSLYYYKRARRYYENDNRALNLAVKLCLDEKQPRKAEMLLKDEISRFKDRIDPYIVLAKLYISTERTSEAKELLENVLTKNSDHIDTLKVLGALKMKLKEFEPAMVNFHKIIQLNPKDVNSLIYYAECADRLGKHNSCQQAATRALKLEPNNPKIIMILANSYMKTLQYYKASMMFKLARTAGFSNEILVKSEKECGLYINQRRVQQSLKAS